MHMIKCGYSDYNGRQAISPSYSKTFYIYVRTEHKTGSENPQFCNENAMKMLFSMTLIFCSFCLISLKISDCLCPKDFYLPLRPNLGKEYATS